MIRNRFCSGEDDRKSARNKQLAEERNSLVQIDNMTNSLQRPSATFIQVDKKALNSCVCTCNKKFVLIFFGKVSIEGACF